MYDALVIGGGIAGCAAAIGLQQAGLSATVYEAHPSAAADAGAFLTLADSGAQALEQLGCTAAVAAVSTPLLGMRLRAGDGTEVAARPLPGYRYLTRADLCRALQQEVRRRGIPVVHGKRLSAVEQRPDRAERTGGEHRPGVTAHFADGTTVAGDLLIGADGLHSVVRTALDPAAPPPRYVGQQVFYGYSSGVELPDPADHIQFVRGAAAFGFIPTVDGEVWWFARVDGDELTAEQLAAAGSHKAQLSARLAADPVPAAVVAAATSVLVTNAYDLPDVATWRSGRVLIVGDAAHAASPATGQGASMALEDAVALAGALRDQPEIPDAFRAYEQLRRERVQANITASAAMSRNR